MEMITGGAYQGKREYAKKIFGFSDDDIADGTVCSETEIFSAKCICSYHIFVKRMLGDGKDPCEITERLCRENTDLIIITDEIGCGIIPLEKKERIWREMTGRCGCIIAANSVKVTRLINSVPAVIKDET